MENNHRNSTSSFAYKNEPLGGTPFIRLLKNKLCVWSNFPVRSRRQLFFCLQWVLDLIVAIHYVVNDRADDHAHFSIILSFHMEHSLILQIFLLIFIKWSFCFILLLAWPPLLYTLQKRNLIISKEAFDNIMRKISWFYEDFFMKNWFPKLEQFDWLISKVIM